MPLPKQHYFLLFSFIPFTHWVVLTLSDSPNIAHCCPEMVLYLFSLTKCLWWYRFLLFVGKLMMIHSLLRNSIIAWFNKSFINQSFTTCVCLFLNPQIFIALIDGINT